MDREKDSKTERKGEDTGTLPCQLSDTVQKETDPGSESGDGIKEKSVRSSEAEEKQTEKTTENQPHSVTQSNREVDEQNDSNRERKGEDTGTLPCQLSDTVQKETDPGSESGDGIKEKSVRSSEAEEKQTESPLNIQKPREKEEMTSDKHEEEMKRDENVQPQDNKDTGTLPCQLSDTVQKETDPGSESGDGIKEKSVRSSEAEEKQTEKTTENQPHSGTKPKKDKNREKGHKLEIIEESPLNIQKPREKEEMTSNKHVKRDENVQPQNNKTIWIAAAVFLLALVFGLYQPSTDSTSSIPKEVNVVDLFNQEMKKLETTFPNQHPELWRRSLIHLRRHLKMKNPTEPVSLILTSDRRAEKTLGCLALGLARAFSTAHNSSVLKINGKNKASQDSDQVKLDIDSELRKAFEGKKSAAVIHHFEELPPGSTLIFYRYCDHENAAYKDVFLAFTVMLDAEVELPSSVSLGRVEEMVQEHIKHKFVSSDKSAMFNQMDVDKLGGLWSRISHLILPVAAEKKFEEQGCGDWD